MGVPESAPFAPIPTGWSSRFWGFTWFGPSCPWPSRSSEEARESPREQAPERRRHTSGAARARSHAAAPARPPPFLCQVVPSSHPSSRPLVVRPFRPDSARQCHHSLLLLNTLDFSPHGPPTDDIPEPTKRAGFQKVPPKPEHFRPCAVFAGSSRDIL